MDEKPQKRIFVVDDDNAIREVLALLIREKGYEVEDFSKGENMIGVLSDKTPDIILLDYFLPGEDTSEIIKIIKDRDRQISIIIMSADVRTERIVETLPVNAFLQKPFHMDTVFQVLSENT